MMQILILVFGNGYLDGCSSPGILSQHVQRVHSLLYQILQKATILCIVSVLMSQGVMFK